MTSLIPNESFLKWDPAQVSNYVASLLPQDSSHLSSKFLDHNIDGSLLPFITTDHLKEIGITQLSTRLLIKKSITDLITAHYLHNPPTSINDPKYKLSNLNINSNYVSLESLTLSTILMKDMFKKLQQQQLSSENSPLSPNPNNQMDMKKLNENFKKLKTDLIPVIRLLRDSKPLPTPTLDPGHTSSTATNPVNSPTQSMHSVSFFDAIQDYKNEQNRSTSMSSSNPALSSSQMRNSSLPSPTYSHRFSSGSLLSMGTGKVVQQSILKPDLTSNNKPELTLNKIPNRTTLRPKLVESKSANSASGPSINGTEDDITSISSSVTNDSNTSTLNSVSTIHNSPSVQASLNKPSLNLRGSLSSTHTVSTLEASPNKHHSSSHHSSNEPLKQLRASSEDSCKKILTQAMKRHHIPEHDWSKYVLVICYGDKERILKLDERPVIIFKELQELGKHPAIMLRMLANMNESGLEDGSFNNSRIGDDIPGGTL